MPDGAVAVAMMMVELYRCRVLDMYVCTDGTLFVSMGYSHCDYLTAFGTWRKPCENLKIVGARPRNHFVSAARESWTTGTVQCHFTRGLLGWAKKEREQWRLNRNLLSWFPSIFTTQTTDHTSYWARYSTLAAFSFFVPTAKKRQKQFFGDQK